MWRRQESNGADWRHCGYGGMRDRRGRDRLLGARVNVESEAYGEHGHYGIPILRDASGYRYPCTEH